MRTPMGKKAFTLIETVVVMTIFSFLALGIGACFISGMKLWERSKDINYLRNDCIFTLEKIARELRQCVDVPEIGFKGQVAQISFPSVVFGRVVKVGYKFDLQEKVLIRTEADLKDVIDEKEKDNTRESKISGLENFSFSYFTEDEEKKEYSWADFWAEERKVFPGVKLDTEVKGEKLSKTIFIPIAG